MTEQAVTFSHYDAADYLQTEEDIARARNMSQLAKEVGMSREGLYKALSGEGNPAFSTISKVANALGIEPLSQPKGNS
ncbi:addiction module antidote protein [Vreelandella rituensis]|uniref:Putative addiction module antidote protein n=1 Tax=Vreelandella rituensis TaxID=2282306 RepID=A0A368TYP5_9GAMM|nr:addiction module antidote protein [Halomonas rituensis]RCV89989.1 putative addiction module antidote protein [Halomonas rituensis]